MLTFLGIVTEWNSEALTPEPDMAAWPTKNATNEVISETTRVTVLNTISFAAYTVPRRGIAVSEVRIIPVEYSDVIVSAPSTAMISWPNSKKAPSEACVASVLALFHGLLCRLDAMAKPAMAAKPTLTMTIAAIVQYVERTERSLVNSERIVPASPARPVAGGSAVSCRLGATALAIVQTPLPMLAAASGTPAWNSTLSAVSSMNASSSEAR